MPAVCFLSYLFTTPIDISRNQIHDIFGKQSRIIISRSENKARQRWKTVRINASIKTYSVERTISLLLLHSTTRTNRIPRLLLPYFFVRIFTWPNRKVRFFSLHFLHCSIHYLFKEGEALIKIELLKQKVSDEYQKMISSRFFPFQSCSRWILSSPSSSFIKKKVIVGDKFLRFLYNVVGREFLLLLLLLLRILRIIPNGRKKGKEV